MTDDELKLAIREHAYLEGDFVLRSGKRSKYYLDKYRFETRPDILAAVGERIARAVAEFEPEAMRLAGPELGAVALAAAGSLSSGLPFLIVRKSAKDYGTSNRLEGVHERGETGLPRRGRRHVRGSAARRREGPAGRRSHGQNGRLRRRP